MKLAIASLVLVGCSFSGAHDNSPDAGNGSNASHFPDAGAHDAGADARPGRDSAVDAQPQCSSVSGTLVDHSLAVTDPAVLARFSFARVMQKIVDTGKPGASPTALFQQWMSTFGSSDCTDPNVDPDHYGLVCPRSAEAKLAGVDPMAAGSAVTFSPVALFDRFDLAPADGSNCGEHRIVYAMHSNDPNIRGRGLLIFEAALPNPSPAQGLVGCLPIAQFWQGLSNLTDSTALADALEKLYFTGDAIPGVPAVVDAAHYGAASGQTRFPGQIRTNMFVDNASWQLREFKTSAVCGTNAACTLTLQHVAVATNPANELFAGTAPSSAAFQAAFLAQVPALATSSLDAIGMSNDRSFDEFESVSDFGSTDVLYDQQASPAFIAQIQSKLTGLGSSLTPADILRRATSQTCAGCHQLSSGGEGDLGGGMSWPASNVFTHVDEQSRLSPALTQEFLPHRKTVLESFINSVCTEGLAPAVKSGLTVGGSRIGAPN